MDRLRAYILILHAKIEREALRRRIEELERTNPMSAKFRGLAAALRDMNGELDAAAGPLLAEIGAIVPAAQESLKTIKVHVEADKQAAQDLAEIAKELSGNSPPSGGSPT